MIDCDAEPNPSPSDNYAQTEQWLFEQLVVKVEQLEEIKRNTEDIQYDLVNSIAEVTNLTRILQNIRGYPSSSTPCEPLPIGVVTYEAPTPLVEANWSKPMHTTEAVIIQKNNESPLEVVGLLKNSLTEAELRNSIVRVKETRNENILLEVAGAEAAKKLKEKVAALLTQKKCGVRTTAEKAIFVELRDIEKWIDEDTLQQSMEEFRRYYRVQGEASLVWFKNTTSNAKKARFVVGEEYGRKLLEVGQIRVGNANCRVSEFRKIVRCYKCLGYGHIALQCRDADSGERRCLSCGEVGHEGKSCNKNFCVVCHSYNEKNKDKVYFRKLNVNHYSGSRRCRIFQEWMRVQKN